MNKQFATAYTRLFLVAFLGMTVCVRATLALDKFEPVSGVYLGVILAQGGTAAEINAFNLNAGKNHAVYAKFVEFKRDEFPWDWINTVKSNCAGAGLQIILEPTTDFEDFFTSWTPGEATYEAALSFVTNCAAAQSPIFLRFAHEANGWWYPWCPSYSDTDNVSNETYIIAWRNFADMVHANAANVAMVWAPNQGNGPGELPYYGHTYPGDDYVDWVGLSVYNGEWYGNGNEVLDYQFRNAIQRGYWQDDTNTLNDTAEDFYRVFADPDNPTGHHKPMMIAETSAQFVPQYDLQEEVIIARFESLTGPSGGPDQTWWTPWGEITAWELTTNAAVGTYALRMAGTDTNADWYIGGNGCTLSAPDGNWTNSNALVLYAKRGIASGMADPKFKITLDNDTTNNNANEATVETRVSNTNYSQIIIPFDDFTEGSAFSWAAIQNLKIELFTVEGGIAPNDLFLDHMRRASATLTNNADNLRWKGDWMQSVFALADNTGPDHPYSADISRLFPNLHMISWFHERKFEDGITKDFTIPSFAGQTPGFATYYASISNSYFIESIFLNSKAWNDYDGDQQSDLAIFDTLTGYWYIYSLTGSVIAWQAQWGWPGAVTVPGDYDGDAKSDLAVYDQPTGNWYAWSLARNVSILWARQWGWPGAEAVSGDYDGDEISDLAVYDQASGYWYIITPADVVLAWERPWGWPGALTVPGDYDGDGAGDLCVYDSLRGYWYAQSLAGTNLAWAQQWGWPGATTVPGDYDGDGIDDLAVYDQSSGSWYAWSLAGNHAIVWQTSWGWTGAMPVPGDYDGDGKDDLAVFDTLRGYWYIWSVARNTTIAWQQPWGWPGAYPPGGRE